MKIVYITRKHILPKLWKNFNVVKKKIPDENINVHEYIIKKISWIWEGLKGQEIGVGTREKLCKWVTIIWNSHKKNPKEQNLKILIKKWR